MVLFGDDTSSPNSTEINVIDKVEWKLLYNRGVVMKTTKKKDMQAEHNDGDPSYATGTLSDGYVTNEYGNTAGSNATNTPFWVKIINDTVLISACPVILYTITYGVEKGYAKYYGYSELYINIGLNNILNTVIGISLLFIPLLLVSAMYAIKKSNCHHEKNYPIFSKVLRIMLSLDMYYSSLYMKYSCLHIVLI